VRYRASVGRDLAGQDAKKRAFAAAVAAEQAELVPGRERQIQSTEQSLAAQRLAEPGRREQLARLPASAGEVDADGTRGRVAVLHLGQFLAPLRRVLDARRRLARASGCFARQPLRLAAHLIGDGLLPSRLAFEKLLAAIEEVVVATGAAEVAGRVDAA